MKARLGRRGAFDATVLWFACAMAFIAGGYVTFGALESAIDAQQRATGAIADALLADDMLLARRPQLERQRQTAQRQLRDLALEADRSTAVARFLRSAARVAADAHVSIAGVDEHAAAPSASNAAVPLSHGLPFLVDSIPLDVTLNGTYRDLLAAIRAFAQTPLAMRMEIAAIEHTTGPAEVAAAAPLTARLHIVLQRLSDEPAAPALHSPAEDASTNARSF